MAFNKFKSIVSQNNLLEIDDEKALVKFIDELFEEGFTDVSIENFLLFITTYIINNPHLKVELTSSITQLILFKISISAAAGEFEQIKLAMKLYDYIDENLSFNFLSLLDYRRYLEVSTHPKHYIYKDHIDSLKLSTRVRYVLIRAGYDSVSTILRKLKEEGIESFYSIPRFNKVSGQELLNSLREHGYLKNEES